jgi:uncharacterized membrane protein
MAFCKACGADVGSAAFCPKCGAGQAATVAAAAPVQTTSGTEGIAENMAGLLCYLFGWVSGLIFLLIDKRPLVRFHGAQSIAFCIALIPVSIVVWIVWWIALLILSHIPFLGILTVIIFPIFWIGVAAVWIFLMYKAYQGEKFKLPIIGNLVEGMVK